jgi:hypothetical protein
MPNTPWDLAFGFRGAEVRIRDVSKFADIQSFHLLLGAYPKADDLLDDEDVTLTLLFLDGSTLGFR